jgi:hypothetical protein
MTAPAWTDDHDLVIGLASALIDASWFDTPRDLLYFFEKPWKYDEQFRLWDACQQPSTTDTNWTWFTAKLEGQE